MLARLLRPSLTLAALLLAVPPAHGQEERLTQSVGHAEASLQRGDFPAAEREYRTALFEGFRLLGVLDGLAGRGPEAREALEAAAEYSGDAPASLLALATAELQVGDAAPALVALRAVVAKEPANGPALRLLARALVATNDIEAGLAALAESARHSGDDPELAFHLGTDYLRLKKPDAAAPLFAAVLAARPIPQSHVLIGRAYRDASEYERATGALRAALAQDPRVRHAHYYLGMILRSDPKTGPGHLDKAIAEFREELKLAPQDPLTNDQLGLALLESERFDAALPALETAVRGDARPLYVYHLGRALLGLERTGDAIAQFKRALELASPQEPELEKFHFQLGLALRKQGDLEGASVQFAEAKRVAAANDTSPGTGPTASVAPLIETSSLGELPGPAREDLKRRVSSTLARACLNLGVMRAQAEQFEAAADFLARAAVLDPSLPQVQASLGIAYFNSRQFSKATAALEKAMAANPNDAGVRRMLAMAWLNTQAFAKAAELLQDDPQREADATLDFAYAMALVKSERGEEAEPIFARLLARHGSSPELSVLVGQAHAQQGDYDGAIATLQHALAMKPDVAEANGTLGVIYLKQGKLPEAEAAFEAELRTHPDDILTRHNLGNVLDLQGRPREALVALRAVLATRPTFVDSRYMVGKILLGQGQAAEAIVELKTAAEQAPGDANIHYQLAQAYQKAGDATLAEQEFEAYRKLKDLKRGANP